MKLVLAVLLGALALYVFMRREGFMPDSRGFPACPGDHIPDGPKYVHTASGDCKLSTDVHNPR